MKIIHYIWQLLLKTVNHIHLAINTLQSSKYSVTGLKIYCSQRVFEHDVIFICLPFEQEEPTFSSELSLAAENVSAETFHKSKMECSKTIQYMLSKNAYSEA